MSSEQLVWPLPWVWVASLRAVPGASDLYFADEDVLSFLNCGRLCLALFRLDGDAERRLEEMCRVAAGEAAEVPRFVMPG